jgi:hypothetical protein
MVNTIALMVVLKDIKLSKVVDIKDVVVKKEGTGNR